MEVSKEKAFLFRAYMTDKEKEALRQADQILCDLYEMLGDKRMLISLNYGDCVLTQEIKRTRGILDNLYSNSVWKLEEVE